MAARRRGVIAAGACRASVAAGLRFLSGVKASPALAGTPECWRFARSASGRGRVWASQRRGPGLCCREPKWSSRSQRFYCADAASLWTPRVGGADPLCTRNVYSRDDPGCWRADEMAWTAPAGRSRCCHRRRPGPVGNAAQDALSAAPGVSRFVGAMAVLQHGAGTHHLLCLRGAASPRRDTTPRQHIRLAVTLAATSALWSW